MEGDGIDHLMRARTDRWTDQESGVESSGEPFMVPSGCGLNMIKGGRHGEWWSLALVIFL